MVRMKTIVITDCPYKKNFRFSRPLFSGHREHYSPSSDCSFLEPHITATPFRFRHQGAARPSSPYSPVASPPGVRFAPARERAPNVTSTGVSYGVRGERTRGRADEHLTFGTTSSRHVPPASPTRDATLEGGRAPGHARQQARRSKS